MDETYKYCMPKCHISFYYILCHQNHLLFYSPSLYFFLWHLMQHIRCTCFYVQTTPLIAVCASIFFPCSIPAWQMTCKIMINFSQSSSENVTFNPSDVLIKSWSRKHQSSLSRCQNFGCRQPPTNNLLFFNGEIWSNFLRVFSPWLFS